MAWLKASLTYKHGRVASHVGLNFSVCYFLLIATLSLYTSEQVRGRLFC